MAQQCSAVAADTKVETPEGSMTIKAVAGNAIAVMTRSADGHHIFRLMKHVEKTAEQQPVLKFTLENGRSFRLAPEQIVFKAGMIESRAGELTVGDALEPAFSFPAGYVYRDDQGSERTSAGAVAVTKIEPGGAADLYRLAVNQTGTFFLSAGVLCKADGD
jgi:hypothetical protein